MLWRARPGACLPHALNSEVEQPLFAGTKDSWFLSFSPFQLRMRNSKHEGKGEPGAPNLALQGNVLSRAGFSPLGESGGNVAEVKGAGRGREGCPAGPEGRFSEPEGLGTCLVLQVTAASSA